MGPEWWDTGQHVDIKQLKLMKLNFMIFWAGPGPPECPIKVSHYQPPTGHRDSGLGGLFAQG